MLPIVSIPSSIQEGLFPYRDLFFREEGFRHILEYCTGLVVLERPSINMLSNCLVGGASQSSINKALTVSPWSEAEVNARRLEQITQDHLGKGLRIGIVDSTFMHHPRGEKKIYGVYKYWDYVNQCYTYAIQLVTSAISTGERGDFFDSRIYHRSFAKEEKAYLNHTVLPEGEKESGNLERRLLEVLCYAHHQKAFKSKIELAVELLKEMGASEIPPDVYTVDSALFAPDVIKEIVSQGKPWVADSEKSRIVYWRGKKFNCESFAHSRPKEAYREVSLERGGKVRKFWVFSCTVHIRKYGKVRIGIIYKNPELTGEPIYCFTHMLTWNAKKIASVRFRRWDIEPMHEQIKHFLGAEDSQLQTEKGVRRHLTLVFVVNSLLKSLDMRKPIGDLPMSGYEANVTPTFGQRCRRILFEVFYDLICAIYHWLEEEKMSLPQIFETLFGRLLYA